MASIASIPAVRPSLSYTACMRRASNLSGIAAMLAATASFVVCDSFMKLVTEDLPPFEVLFVRGIAASLACAVLLGDWRAAAGGRRDAQRALLYCRSRSPAGLPMWSPSSRRGRWS